MGSDGWIRWLGGDLAEEALERHLHVLRPQVAVLEEGLLVLLARGLVVLALLNDAMHVEAHLLVLLHLFEKVPLRAVEPLDELRTHNMAITACG